MGYETELKFTEKLLKNFRLTLNHITSEPEEDFSFLSNFGLEKILHFSTSKEDLLQALGGQCKPNTIYRVYDAFFCNYLLFCLPDTDSTEYITIGPYSLKFVSEQDIYKVAERFQISSKNVPQLEQFYRDIPYISDENILLTIIYTLGEHLWGSIDNFTTQNIEVLFSVDSETLITKRTPDEEETEDALLSMQLLEERYEAEQKLMQAVTAGQVHKAELAFTSLASRSYEQRISNSLRNMKNYAFVLNTILRLAAESGTVHPLHIDHISSQYARKIEMITSETALTTLTKEMVRKYCLLVKNHSLKGYSLLVQKIITRIDADLTADLSLKTQAELLNVNSSYLSTLFKKETGITLTEYVNRKRIEHALFLLNSTNMQIQMVAQYCGISDVNYFTKIFKKMIGKTPKEYRENLL